MSNNTYAPQENESTSAWLKRLITIGAPSDIRGNVQALLEYESRQQAQPPAGKD